MTIDSVSQLGNTYKAFTCIMLIFVRLIRDPFTEKDNETMLKDLAFPVLAEITALPGGLH